MKKILFCVFFLPTFLLSQIQIDKAGDGWDEEVQKALHLIYGTSETHYENIINNVKKIEFWNQNYSSNDGKGVIVIAAKDMKLNSINNVAAVLVHESCHIVLNGSTLSPNKEETECYVYELVFLSKLQNVEPELILNCKQQIENYKK
jgi:hypothetical protein